MTKTEKVLLHRAIAAAYDTGGELEDDERLLQYCTIVLTKIEGHNPHIPLSTLRKIRDFVAAGQRL